MGGTTKWIIGGVVVLGVIIGGSLLMKPSNLIPNPSPAEEKGAATQTAENTLPETKNSEPKKTMDTIAILHTTMGDITIQLDKEHTPKTVENFTKLASAGFYDGTKFHRVIKDFMIQGGDPLSKDDTKSDDWGTGGPGYKFDDEIKPTNSNAKGTISMANAGPNTNGSQFFINVADNGFLNGKHTVFGHVTSGYDIVEKISMVQTAPGDRPLTAIAITSVELK